MKKELLERGNGTESEDFGTDFYSSDEGGSNQIPVISNALGGTSSLPIPSGSSVSTLLVHSSSFCFICLQSGAATRNQNVFSKSDHRTTGSLAQSLDSWILCMQYTIRCGKK
jgi:hypothetical protein